jgi:hypothetical protein
MKKILIPIVAVLLLCSCKKNNHCPKDAVNANCICPGVIVQVCGCNKVTYENACQAQCDGITTYTMGKCP